MCTPSTPPIHFRADAAPLWADTINHLSGLLVTLTMLDGSTVTGELLGDGETGRYLRLRVSDGPETIMARSVLSILVL